LRKRSKKLFTFGRGGTALRPLQTDEKFLLSRSPLAIRLFSKRSAFFQKN
jgi:hypothetical protein